MKGREDEEKTGKRGREEDLDEWTMRRLGGEDEEKKLPFDPSAALRGD